jgi:aspartyl-tRNA synthetase
MKLGWLSPKIDEFVDKLDKLRSSLTLATVLAFRTSAERNNEEVLAHLRGIKQEHQARQINETKVQTTIQHLMRTVQNHTGDTINIFQREIQVCLNEINALRDSLGLADRTSGKERCQLSCMLGCQ